MTDFSDRFEIIYQIFSAGAEGKGYRVSKLAMAKYLGITQGKMQSWESGQVPKPDDLELLHNKFGLSYEWLLTGKGKPRVPEIKIEQTDKMRMAQLEKENSVLKMRLEQAESELREERSLNRQLAAKLLVEGNSNEKSADTAKAVGQE